jgi:hypothetical protein
MIVSERIKETRDQGRTGMTPRRRTMMKLHLLLQAARQVLHRTARLKHAIAVERKDILVLNAPSRTQSRRMIGTFGNPSYICRLNNKMNKKTMSQLLTMQVLQAIVHQESVGVDYSLQEASRKKVTTMTINKWDPDLETGLP